MTNAEKLAKDTDRFARIFNYVTVAFCDICPMRAFCDSFIREHYIEDCSDIARVWLKQEAEEDEE